MHSVARAVTVLAGAVAIQAASAQSDCDRACLESLAGRYLEALVARAPDRLPLTDDVEFTENGQALEVGSALWATASGAAGDRLYVADTIAGQVGSLGVLEENGQPIMLAVRLRVRDGRIAEIEHIVARPQAGSPSDLEASRAPRPLLTAAVPLGARVPRGALAGIANSYFSGLDALNSGRQVPFHEACRQVENGVDTANANDDPDGLRALGCAQQLDTGFSKFVTEVRGRRFPVVDEERGLLLAVALLDHAGEMETVELADGQTFEVPAAFRSPSSRLVGQVFKIEGGLIRHMEAVVVDVPYRMPSGW